MGNEQDWVLNILKDAFKGYEKIDIQVSYHYDLGKVLLDLSKSEKGVEKIEQLAQVENKILEVQSVISKLVEEKTKRVLELYKLNWDVVEKITEDGFVITNLFVDYDKKTIVWGVRKE